MPVTLLYVDQARWEADEHLRHDLERIYDDAPQERIQTREVGPFIEQHLQSRQFFACAHFNERLLGAVAIFEADDRAWWLSELCVRKNTRRRGVGSRLMALLGEQAKQDGRKLRIETGTLPLADRMLLAKLGYRPFPGQRLHADEKGSGGPMTAGNGASRHVSSSDVNSSDVSSGNISSSDSSNSSTSEYVELDPQGKG